MKLSRQKIIFVVLFFMLFSTITYSAATKKIKTFKISDSITAPPVGGNMKHTDRNSTQSFRVSSDNIIYRDSLKVTTTHAGRGGSCELRIDEEKEFEVQLPGGLPPTKIKYPTKVSLLTHAISPGCNVLNPGCVGKDSRRECELTGKYTD